MAVGEGVLQWEIQGYDGNIMVSWAVATASFMLRRSRHLSACMTSKAFVHSNAATMTPSSLQWSPKPSLS